MRFQNGGLPRRLNQSLKRRFSSIPGSIELTLGLSLATACSMVAVAETRQHGSHQHGSAILNVAIADQVLSVEYITPAANIVGFEHTPSTEDQKNAVHEVTKLLETGKVLNIPDEAGCTLTHVEVEHEAKSEEHAKEGSDEHEEHEEDEGTHSEFHVRYEYQCENMVAVAHIDVELFKYFPATEKITTQIITPSGQKGVELTPNSTRLILP